MKKHLLEELQRLNSSDFYPLHMPGHKRQMRLFSDVYGIDITEIDGFDNLHHAEGILLEAQTRAARLYGADESFFLVNGSTCGILAAISAQTRRQDRILVSRNCHKSVYHAILLNGLQAVYLEPEMDWERGISGAISPQSVNEALKRYPDIKTVLLTSPTYDGIVSDIKTISEIVHSAGGVLIVDEAHGAHFALSEQFPESALHCGADIVINSLHKTLPSLTQTAILHIKGERSDRKQIRKYLGIYQSSSPSYVLMASMDACIELMEQQGALLFAKFTKRLAEMRNRLKNMKVLHLLDGTEEGLYVWKYDPSKVLISTENSGITAGGPWLADRLRKKYHLEVEMEAEHYITAIMTICDSEEGFQRLENALCEIDDELSKIEKLANAKHELSKEAYQMSHGILGDAGITMEEAENSPQRRVLLLESAGEISAEFAYLYPPGIPFLVPGERIPRDIIQRMEQYQNIGLRLQGLSDYSGKWIEVVAGEEDR